MALDIGEGDAPNKFSPINKLCLSLQSEDKRLRKQALIDFESHLKNQTYTDEDYHYIFKEAHIHLLNTLRDKSEPVREQGIKFIKYYLIEVLIKNDYYLSYLFPVLIERLGSVEIIEESEEIRLQLVLLMQSVVDKYCSDNQLKPFLNDFVTVLRETVQDKYPAIKEASCKCIVSLALALPRDFHMQAESLVKPILTAFTHQRFKIRIEAIKCIGEVVLHSTYKAVEDVVGPLAERLFDQIPAVRRTIAQVTARWLLEYRDRYSFFSKLLPLILTGLNDEVPETREESHRLWLTVGLQYQKENEKDLKDQLDYLTQPPKYYPPNLTRPNLGCRTMVQRTISKLTAALARELMSWQPDVRVRCSQLLCAVALHAEDGITQHLHDLLLAMYSAARDEDERVVVNIIQASELISIFVPVDTWKKLIVPIVEDEPHFGHLMVLAAFIRASPQEYVASSLREFSQILSDPSISHSRKMKYQKELINCVKAIQSKYSNELSEDIGQFLFNVIVTVLSIKDSDNVDIDYVLLEKLRDTLSYDSDYTLWSKFSRKLLESINKDPRAWTEVTIERCIFETILLYSAESFGENLDVIGNILVEALDTEVEAESRLKTFCALSDTLENKDVIFKRASGLQMFLEKLVEDVLVPSLVWHAGRTAEAMRTMAASCLCSALSPGAEIDLFGKEEIRAIFDKVSPLLLSLIEDASYRSRHLAMENLVLLKESMERKNNWEADNLIKIYPEIIKRLDDPTDKVRICAIQSLGRILKNPPDEFKKDVYKAHFELLIDTLITHFDDDDDLTFQNIVYEVLLQLANVCSEIMEDKVTKYKPIIRNQDGCDKILQHLRTIKL